MAFLQQDKYSPQTEQMIEHKVHSMFHSISQKLFPRK